MNKQALMAGLAALVLHGAAAAQAIPFFNIAFDTSTIALASDGPAGINTQSGLLGLEPVSVAADSVGTVDVATAGAIIAADLLTTSADVSASGISSAVASTNFIGSFVNGAGVNLSLDFSALDVASGSGGAASSLFVSVTSNGITLFQDFVQPGVWQFAYAAQPGTVSVLDLTLSSEVNAAFLSAGPGNASAFGMVTVAGVVPEASTWLMFSLGLGAVAAARSRSRRQPVAA